MKDPELLIDPMIHLIRRHYCCVFSTGIWLLVRRFCAVRINNGLVLARPQIKLGRRRDEVFLGVWCLSWTVRITA